MASHVIFTLLSLCSDLLPSIKASALASSSSSSSLSNNNSEKNRRKFEEDLEWLQRTLMRIHATLYDAEERAIRDLSVRLWLKELKAVAYDAEDVLSEYRYEATRVQVEARKASEDSGPHKRKQMELIVQIPDGMMDQLSKIRSQFDVIVNDLTALRLADSDLVRPLTCQSPSGPWVDGMSIFGRDAEVTKVINLLISEDKNPFSVISIIGIGGLGKTTIAQLVYKDIRARQHFDLVGWVCVSEHFDVSRLIKVVVESVSKMECDLSDFSSLQEELVKVVKGKRILLVLDDVWNENESLWMLFRAPLKEAEVVRILVTTRNENVAKVMGATACLRPSYLPENSCWQLFQYYAFDNTNCIVPTNFTNIGMEIMKKCGGLPLAVKAIACVLRYEKCEDTWIHVLESELWESDASSEIFTSHQISYDHLPAYLKPCFLLCSMYPKDYVLEKMNLIELWISHGYIKSEGRKLITEIGAQYYEELKERSFLDDVVHQFSECCKLHNIIHDFARLCSDNEYYSVDINQSFHRYEANILQNTHHLYATGFMGYVDQISQQNRKGLRTLAVDVKLQLLEKYRDSLGNTSMFNFAQFEALRVLEIKGDHLKISDSIALLRHLSHLRISSDCLEYIPESIGLLYNMQTLILDCRHSPLECVPKSIGYLANLRYIHIECANLEKMPRSLCLLTNLERLVIKSEKLEKLPADIKKLCNLRELIIDCKITLKTHYNPHGLENFTVMKKMGACLSVRSIACLKDIEDIEGELAIEGLVNTSNLIDGKIETMALQWHDDHKQKHTDRWDIKELTIKLQVEEPEKDKIVGLGMDYGLLEGLQPHPHLKKLLLAGYPSATLPGWMGNLSSLQSIHEITLHECNALQSLPFHDLHSLRHLQVHKCSAIRLLQLGQLPFQLERLEISGCEELDELQWLEPTEPSAHSSHEKPPGGRQSSLSLTCLHIADCPLLRVLPCELISTLEELTIEDCLNIVELPTLPLSLIKFKMLNVGIISLPDLYQSPGNTDPAQSVLRSSLRVVEITVCPNLSSLNGFLQQSNIQLVAVEEIHIIGCENLELLPIGGFVQFTSLMVLTLEDNPKLKKKDFDNHLLPAKLRNLFVGNCGELDMLVLEFSAELTTLTQLKIQNCENISSIPSENAFKSLGYLSISGCSKLVELSNQDQKHCIIHGSSSALLKLTTLDMDQLSLLLIEPLKSLISVKELIIWGCSGMKALPEEWLFQNYSTLENLQINDASTLRSLPSMMTRLIALETLVIDNAIMLKELPDLPASLKHKYIRGARYLSKSGI